MRQGPADEKGRATHIAYRKQEARVPVKIRLRRMGAKKRPFYRLVAANSTDPRDGRFLETIGYYDPNTDPATVKIDEDKALKWLSNGAQPTDVALSLLKRQGVMDKLAAAKGKPAQS